MAKNTGKNFESIIKSNAPSYFKMTRIPDPPQSFTQRSDTRFSKKNPYDFEIFEYDWLVVLIDPIHKTKDIICNNRPALQEYYESHKDMIWVGYNSSHYDVPILKTILNGNDPKKMSDGIILEGKKPYDIDSML